jgi:hypothetical protein
MSKLAVLAQFAKDHLNIDVRYQFENFNRDTSEISCCLTFLAVGVALTVSLRGDEDSRLVREAILGSNFWHMDLEGESGCMAPDVGHSVSTQGYMGLHGASSRYHRVCQVVAGIGSG